MSLLFQSYSYFLFFVSAVETEIGLLVVETLFLSSLMNWCYYGRYKGTRKNVEIKALQNLKKSDVLKLGEFWQEFLWALYFGKFEIDFCY